MSDLSKKRAGYEKQNLEASRIILADPNLYGGEGSLVVSWARAIQRTAADVEHVAQAEPNGQGRLFAREAA
jgi:hypothetical protein